MCTHKGTHTLGDKSSFFFYLLLYLLSLNQCQSHSTQAKIFIEPMKLHIDQFICISMYVLKYLDFFINQKIFVISLMS